MFTEWRERRRYEKAVIEGNPVARFDIASKISSPYLITTLACSTDIQTLLGVLENPNINAKQVESVACEEKLVIATAVVEHPLCTERVLGWFSTSKDYRIRLLVATRHNLPSTVVNILSKDKIPTIKYLATRGL